jgi:hypothetical protein
VKRLVVLRPEHPDLSREFSSSFLLRDLTDPSKANGQLLFDGIVWRFDFRAIAVLPSDHPSLAQRLDLCEQASS